MSLMPGDMSYDWLDVTDQVKAGYFIVHERAEKQRINAPLLCPICELCAPLSSPTSGR